MENETPDNIKTQDRIEILESVDHVQLSPLSIQAAALVRSIDALSNIFWISLGGTFLTIFFAGLSRLQAYATTDFIFLGEYQVPKSILPLASLSFAMFAFWMTSNRLRMLCYALRTSGLPKTMVHELFHLNPPVLHVFDRDNIRRWSPFTGVAVLILNWSVFFGNSIALTLSSAVQQVASMADFDFALLSIYAVVIVIVLTYGIRSISGPLRDILSHLHNVDFTLGWPRVLGGAVIILAVLSANNIDQFVAPGEQPDDLLGPAIANAIDGETLYIKGVEVNLFGIDAAEPNQICQDAAGEDYSCGRAATRALQNLVQNTDVVCRPLFTVSETKVVGICRLSPAEEATPQPDQDFTSDDSVDSLSLMMVEQGHALGVGLGAGIFEQEQNQAQTLRLGIWQGSFEPPATWRSHN